MWRLTVGQPCTFYAADNSILSPFGDWTVVITSPNIMEAVRVVPTHPNRMSERFTLDVQPGNILTVDPRAGVFTLGRGTNGAEVLSETAPDAITAEQSQAPSLKTVSVNAWLGDSRDSSGTPGVTCSASWHGWGYCDSPAGSRYPGRE